MPRKPLLLLQFAPTLESAHWTRLRGVGCASLRGSQCARVRQQRLARHGLEAEARRLRERPGERPGATSQGRRSDGRLALRSLLRREVCSRHCSGRGAVSGWMRVRRAISSCESHLHRVRQECRGSHAAQVSNYPPCLYPLLSLYPKLQLRPTPPAILGAVASYLVLEFLRRWRESPRPCCARAQRRRADAGPDTSASA